MTKEEADTKQFYCYSCLAFAPQRSDILRGQNLNEQSNGFASLIGAFDSFKSGNNAFKPVNLPISPGLQTAAIV